jgi:hypothetical protein
MLRIIRFGRILNRGSHTLIGTAAAYVSLHGRIDAGIAWIRIAGQKRRRRHHLTRLAITTLNHVELEPGGLDLSSARSFTDRLDCRNNRRPQATDSRYARAGGSAVDQDGARSTSRNTAPELCARHTQHIAQNPKQRHIPVDVYCPVHSIHVDTEGHRRLRIAALNGLKKTAVPQASWLVASPLPELISKKLGRLDKLFKKSQT